MSILKDELLVNLAGQPTSFGPGILTQGYNEYIKESISSLKRQPTRGPGLPCIPVPEAVARMPASDSNVQDWGLPIHNEISIATYLERDYVNPNLD